MTRSLWVWVGLSTATVALCGCTFKREDHPAACGEERRCGSGEECIDGFCVKLSMNRDDAGGSSGRGGSDSGGKAGTGGGDASTQADASGNDGGKRPGEACADGTEPEDCYDGESETLDVGECRGGQRACVNGVFTQCLGQVVPEAEVCNERDDDCNGTVDDIEGASCNTGMDGLCAAGTPVCHGGPVAICQPMHSPVEEVCNAEDDDCDGETDEIAASECFPANESGCTKNDDGSFTCLGLCRVGRATCEEGADACVDAVIAVTEECTPASERPVDEDCDGLVDEGCVCTGDETRDCYAGPPNTEGQGACMAGTQTCMDDSWGPCVGQVLPQPETCANPSSDDDCNGNVDDVPGLGESCIPPGALGICAEGTKKCAQNEGLPTCVGRSPETELCDEIDQDCDGNPTNGFDLGSDKHCGRCGNACGSDATCCRGDCVKLSEFRHDANNCGACGRRCGSGNYCCWNDCIPYPEGSEPVLLGGQLPPKTICGCEKDCRDLMCCGQECVDLKSDVTNCGACGTACKPPSRANPLGEECCNGVCQPIGIIKCKSSSEI